MYRKRKQGRLNRKVAHTGISLLHFPSALPEPALPPLLRTTLRAGGDTLSHLISFLYHRWCAVRPGASEAPRLRAETHSGVQARPYGRGISLMRRRKAAAEPGVAGGHFALRASWLHFPASFIHLRGRCFSRLLLRENMLESTITMRALTPCPTTTRLDICGVPANTEERAVCMHPPFPRKSRALPCCCESLLLRSRMSLSWLARLLFARKCALVRFSKLPSLC